MMTGRGDITITLLHWSSGIVSTLLSKEYVAAEFFEISFILVSTPMDNMSVMQFWSIIKNAVQCVELKVIFFVTVLLDSFLKVFIDAPPIITPAFSKSDFVAIG